MHSDKIRLTQVEVKLVKVNPATKNRILNAIDQFLLPKNLGSSDTIRLNLFELYQMTLSKKINNVNTK